MSKRIQIRRAVKEFVSSTEKPDRSDVVESISDDTEIDEETIDDEIDALEKHGFVYLVNGTVKLP